MESLAMAAAEKSRFENKESGSGKQLRFVKY